MFNPFKRKKVEKKQPISTNQSTISAEELIDEVKEESSNEDVETELSLNPAWKVDQEQVYVYRFMNNENPPLKPNQLSLAGFELNKLDHEVAVGAFVRNSLNQKINFTQTTILLVNDHGTKLARKEFDLTKLGELPPRSSRPFVFIFEEKDLFIPLNEVPTEGWSLSFELKKPSQKHSLDLAESWHKSMANDEIESLQKYTESLEPPKPGEVNFLALQAVQTENEELHVTMLIRNGSEKNLNLQQLPLHVEDASGEVIARGGFQFDNFEVKGNTSKPWTFIFPKQLINKDNIDLTEWKAYPKQ